MGRMLLGKGVCAYFSFRNANSMSGIITKLVNSIFYEIGIVRPIRHYFTNFIEANRIEIVIINPDIPLLTDEKGRSQYLIMFVWP